MTPPDEFYKAVTASMEYLDTKLPHGSNVVIIGLVDGRVLWNTMHDQIHPIGVKYADLYDYLGCQGSNPCNGWLTSNATMRNVTTAWAESLNAQYTKVSAPSTCASGRPPSPAAALVAPAWTAREPALVLTLRLVLLAHVLDTQLVATQKYEHFNMYFNNPDWELFIQRYVNAGGIAKELIE